MHPSAKNFKFLVLKFIAVLSFQRDFAVGICNKISEMIQGMYASFSILKWLKGFILVIVAANIYQVFIMC